jgi:tetratricopeptide (TPR) repeat protein
MKQYDLGDYEAALDAFKAAYLTRPEAELLFDMAQCYRRMGRPKDAVGAYTTYLRRARSAENRADVEQFIAEGRSQIEAERLRQEGLPEKQPAKSAPRPLYRSWWLWTAIGAAATSALVIGLAVGLAPHDQSVPATTAGTITFP